MDFKVIGSIMITSTLLLTGCGNNESKQENKETQTDVKSNKKDNIQEKMIKDSEKYYKELNTYAETLISIALKYDETMKDTELLSEKHVKTLNESAKKFENSSEKFNENVKNLPNNAQELEKLLNRISKVYSMSYKEMASNLDVGVKDSAYDNAAVTAGMFTYVSLISALEELTFDVENYGKERLDAELSEKTANDLNEMVYTSSDDVDEAFKSMHELSINLDNVPEDANDKLITPGFTFELYKVAGMHDEPKEVTMSEYNENVDQYNNEIHPLLSMGKIDEPTTITIGNNLITRMNSMVEVYDENNIPYGEE